MFKKYIRTQPAAIQLMILLSFWSVLILLLSLVLPVVIKAVVGTQFDDYGSFLEKEMYQYPALVLGMNAANTLFVFLLPALIFSCLAAPEPLKYLGLTQTIKRKHLFLIIGLGIMITPVINILGSWIKEINFGAFSDTLDEERTKMLQNYATSGSVGTMLINVFFIALLPALGEELFFRGIVQRFTHTWFKKWWLSIGLSAFLFTLFHASISEFVPIFLAGLLLGWVYYLTSSLWLSILLHFLNNGIQVAIAYFGSGSTKFKEFDQHPANMIGLFVTALLLMIIFVYRLVKSKTPLPDTWSVVFKDEEGTLPQN